jgi:endoglucanase
MGTFKARWRFTNTGAIVVDPNPNPGVDADPMFAQWDSGTRVSGVIPWDQYDAYLVKNSKDVAGFSQLKDGSTAAYYGDQTKMDGLNPVRWNLRKYRANLTSITVASRGMSGPMTIYYVKRGEFAMTQLAVIPTAGEGTQTYTLPSATAVVAVVIVGPTRTDYPSEVTFNGSYIAPAAVAQTVRKRLFEEVTGANAFFWNWEAADGFSKAQNSALYSGQHGVMRHYAEADYWQVSEGQYVWSPSNNKTGTWDGDEFYRTLKAAGITVVGCTKSSPLWKRTTWPKYKPGETPITDPNNPGMQHPEQIPVVWQGTFAATLAWAEKAEAYTAQADFAFQYAGRYGSTPVDLSRMKVAPAQLNDQGQPLTANVKKSGLNYVGRMQDTNEPDSFWRGDWSYSTSAMSAARCSAFYDGHKGALGANMGAKTADPNMIILTAAVAVPDAGYVDGMIDWCRENRGYKADGSVNTPWDELAYHNYSNDGGAVQFGANTKRGVCPEFGGMRDKMRYWTKWADEHSKKEPVWIDEFGYDVSEQSDQSAIRIIDIVRDGSNNLVTYPIAGVYRYQLKDGANRVNRLLVQGQWLVRTILLAFIEGVWAQVYWHKDTQPSEFDRYTTSGMVEADGTRRISGLFFYQLLALLKGYQFDSVLGTDPYVVKATKGANTAYIYWIPDEVNRTGSVQINLPSAGTNHVLSTTGTVTTQTAKGAGLQTFTATETPALVIC